MQYILHPTLAVNIITTNRRYISYFENEYQRVSRFTPNADHAVINVHVVDQLPAKQAGDRLRKVDFVKMLRHTYLVRGLHTQYVDIFFKDSIAGKLYEKFLTLFLQTQVLEPVIYLKLLERDVLFMHAAGVSDGKYGYLFPAYGGTGKTTLTLGLMGEGMRVLGDDLVLVESPARVVYPYLRPLHIFSYNVNTLRGAVIPLMTRAKLVIKDMIRVILEATTRQKFLISTRVHADTLYKTFKPGDVVPYRKIVFLKNTGQDEKVEITTQNVKAFAEQIRESEDLNDSLYANILEPDEKPQVVDREIEVISNVLREVPYFESINVRQLDFRDLSSFRQKLVSDY